MLDQLGHGRRAVGERRTIAQGGFTSASDYVEQPQLARGRPLVQRGMRSWSGFGTGEGDTWGGRPVARGGLAVGINGIFINGR